MTALAAGLLACLAACSAMPLAQAPYERASALSPAGYWETLLSEDRVRIHASGDAATAPARVEKIAMARAAEYGIELKLPYFKVESVNHDVACQKQIDGYRGAKAAASARPTVALDVHYAKRPPDPSYRSAKEAFSALKAELDADLTAPDPAAGAAVKARCGQA